VAREKEGGKEGRGLYGRHMRLVYLSFSHLDSCDLFLVHMPIFVCRCVHVRDTSRVGTPLLMSCVPPF